MKSTQFRLFRFSLELCRKTRSSTQWLQRQRKDQFVKQAVLEQYRCRSAFKLIELDDKHHIFRKGIVVIDCGAKPGSWSQVAARKIGTELLSHLELISGGSGMVLSVDIGTIPELPGAVTLGGCDILDPRTRDKISEHLGGRKADVFMSDIAPNASGIHDLDHHRIIELCESAAALAFEVLCEGGHFLCKALQGAHTTSFVTSLRSNYGMVKECRLKSSRKESREVYILAKGFLKS